MNIHFLFKHQSFFYQFHSTSFPIRPMLKESIDIESFNEILIDGYFPQCKPWTDFEKSYCDNIELFLHETPIITIEDISIRRSSKGFDYLQVWCTED